MTVQGHLTEFYGTEVSMDLSRVTDAVLYEMREGQDRQFDPVYPLVFFATGLKLGGFDTQVTASPTVRVGFKGDVKNLGDAITKPRLPRL
jgi:hypothetical protein